MESFKLPHAMIQPTLRNCENCVHAIPENIAGQLVKQLVCHRFPPQILLIPAPKQATVSRISLPGQDTGTAMLAQSMFPVVSPQMFCHSHTMRAEDPTEAVEVREP